MRILLVVMAALTLAACGQSDPPPKGDRGEVGPAGPVGPPGPVGDSKTRMVTAPCPQALCAAGCNDDEQILNAYALNPGGAINFEDERHLTFRPRKTPAVLVLACVKK